MDMEDRKEMYTNPNKPKQQLWHKTKIDISDFNLFFWG